MLNLAGIHCRDNFFQLDLGSEDARLLGDVVEDPDIIGKGGRRLRDRVQKLTHTNCDFKQLFGFDKCPKSGVNVCGV